MLELLGDGIAVTMATASVTQIALAVVTFGLVISWFWKRNSANMPPGPKPLPFFGNLRELNGIGLADKATEWKEQYGPVFTMYLSSSPTIVLSSIEAVTEAYINKGDDFANKPHVVSLDAVSDNGNDIAFAEISEALKYRRKVVMQSLRVYLTGSQHTERIHNIVETTVANMKQEKGAFDIEDHIFHTVFNVLHVLCFGNTLPRDDERFRKLHTFFLTTSGQIVTFWEDTFPFLRHFPTQRFRQMVRNNKEFVAYLQGYINKSRGNFEEEKTATFLNTILDAQKQLRQQNREMQEEGFNEVHLKRTLSDVFFAAIDTTRHTLAWLFLVLATRPDIQKKVQAEIDEVVGEAVPGREHRPGLVYTEAVVHEVLRLYPAAPMGLPHETLRDTTLMGYEIPAKTGVMVNQYAILRDPNHWEKPDSFLPERFLDTEGGKLKLKNKSWIPFSIGQRNCVGEFLAKQNLFYITTGILQQLEFTLDPDTPADLTPEVSWTTRPCKPFKVIARSRR